jgi:hypothetical protein
MFFSSIHSLEEANITKVYAGGDHSLVLLDKNKPRRTEPKCYAQQKIKIQ